MKYHKILVVDGKEKSRVNCGKETRSVVFYLDEARFIKEYKRDPADCCKRCEAVAIEEGTISKVASSKLPHAKLIKAIKKSIKPDYDKWAISHEKYYCDLQSDIKELEENHRNEFGGCRRQTPESKKAYEVKAATKLKKCGGSWRLVEFVQHASLEDIKKKVQKDLTERLLKIDVAVNKKLYGVSSTKPRKVYTRIGNDGYVEGAWVINKKTFEFRTIYAGGYNIQCFHIRTLFTYK